MRWLFHGPEDLFPTLEADELATTTEETSIVETPFDGCAWCGTGEGICCSCTEHMFAQSAAIAQNGGHRS